MGWATSGTVTDGIAAELAEVLTGEKPPSAGIDVGWRPSTATVLLALLGGQGTVGQEERGPSFVLVDLPDPVERVECWASAHVDPVELKGLMPEHDRRNLVAPWAVAVVDGAVAAVCETARSAPASVEAGVWTYEPYRRQGFGAAATAAWATLAADRTVFYSTSWDNRASQRLAHSLGLRPLGHWWWVHRG